jgi:hypothetical protein
VVLGHRRPSRSTTRPRQRPVLKVTNAGVHGHAVDSGHHAAGFSLDPVSINAFLDDARKAGFTVLPAAADDERPIQIGPIRVSATVRVFECKDARGRKTREFHELWVITLAEPDARLLGNLEVCKQGSSGYGGIAVELGRGLTAVARDSEGLDRLTDRTKQAIAAIDRVAPLMSFSVLANTISASCRRTRTNLTVAKNLASAVETAIHALHP